MATILGFFSSNWLIKFFWCIGEIINGIELLSTFLSESFIAKRFTMEVAEQAKIVLIGVIESILSIGIIDGRKNSYIIRLLSLISKYVPLNMTTMKMRKRAATPRITARIVVSSSNNVGNKHTASTKPTKSQVDQSNNELYRVQVDDVVTYPCLYSPTALWQKSP